MQVFEKIKDELQKTSGIGRSSLGVFLEILNRVQEEYNNGWIPCSSVKLPKENIEVDVTVEEIDGGRYIQTSWLQDGQWVIKKSPLKPKVIAWKERPEPYQPKGE